MKIIVPVKRVVDFNVKIRAKSDGSGVDITNVKMSMNHVIGEDVGNERLYISAPLPPAYTQPILPKWIFPVGV